MPRPPPRCYQHSAARTGTRTLDPQIKSLMLYRLSYPGSVAGEITTRLHHHSPSLYPACPRSTPSYLPIYRHTHARPKLLSYLPNTYHQLTVSYYLVRSSSSSSGRRRRRRRTENFTTASADAIEVMPLAWCGMSAVECVCVCVCI